MLVPARGSVTPELLGRLLDEQGGALALYAAQWTDAADDCVQEALIELAGQREEPASRLRPREGEAPAEPLVDALELAAALEALDETLREAVVARTWGGLG